MTRSKVAVLRVRPDHVLEDIDRLYDLAGVQTALKPGAQTILKDNISWHFPFPGANTTPWQLEGTVRSLRTRGYSDLVCVQNKTVVTDAFKGEDLNGYLPIFKRYDIPVRYNFKPEDMTWSVYKPRAKMNVLDNIFPEGIQIPDAFHGTNIVHLPTVKCVSGATEVTLGDGTVTTIRALFEQQLRHADLALLDADRTVSVQGRASLFAMDPTGAVRPLQATHFARSRRDGRRVVKARMKTGRELTATADHLVFTHEGWQKLGELDVGSRVAIARRVAVDGTSQRLPQTHARPEIPAIAAKPSRAHRVELVQTYRGGQTVTAIAARAQVRWQAVQHVLVRHGVPLRRNVIPVRIPAQTSPAFWRWLGYFIAEGCAEDLDKGAGKIWWTNTDPALREELIALSRDLFGVEARGRNAAQISIYSRDLVRFLSELGLEVPCNSGNKTVPRLLHRCPPEEIAAFLSGYLDADGTVSSKQAEVSAVTKSAALARGLVTLFSRLGVVACIKPVEHRLEGWSESRTYWMVVVSGAQVAVLARWLSLRHAEKASRLHMHTSRLETSRQASNWDVVPLPPALVQQVRVAADHDDSFAEELAQLRLLAHEDLAWDVIVSVDDVSDAEDDLYDVTVPGAGSFIANGIVAHNCHIYTTTTGAMKNAFGGLLNTKRHYTHSWIHATLVDLLAIQKEIHAGLFAIMDGTTAGDGPGPRTMRPVIKDVMLAAEDQVAIDAVAASMMGFDPMSLEYLRLADEQGLGNARRENIEVVGDVELADQRWGFSVGDNGASMVGDVMWFGPLKRFQKLFFHTPLVNLFVMGSEAYHDYYRWPLRDRRVFEQWRDQTTWGRLFDHYQAHGTLAPADVAKVG